MKRMICGLLVLAALLGCLLPAVQAGAEADTLRSAKKVISVVYDDSGSMKGDRWVYANYAVQALTALLNAQDQLFITYMSQPTRAVPVDTGNISGAVEEIRKLHVYAQETPARALDTARKALDTVTGEDRSTQYWLVVLTDGVIQNLGQSLQSRLDSYKGAVMPNGSALNTVYLTMLNQADTMARPDPAGGLYTYCAEDAASITGNMAAIANLIACRLTADTVTQVNGTTFRFTSRLPMYSVSVLSQNSNATVVSGSIDSVPLLPERNIGLHASEPSGATATVVTGNAAVLTERAGGVIPAGDVTVTFSQAVRPEDLVIQYAPAIGLQLRLRRSGVEVDGADLYQDDRVEVELLPVIPGTDQVIPTNDLPASIGWQLEYLAEESLIASGDGKALTDVVIRSGANVLRGTLRIPGFAPIVFERSFYIAPFVYAPAILAEQPEPLSYMRGELSQSLEGGEPAVRITNDGVELPPAEQKRLGMVPVITDVSCDSSVFPGFWNWMGAQAVKCHLKANDDGSYTLAHSWGQLALWVMAGDYTVTVALENDPAVTAQVRFRLIPHWTDWLGILTVAAIALLLFLLLDLLVFKRKFSPMAIRRESYVLQKDRGVYQTSQLTRLTRATGIFSFSLRTARTHLPGLRGRRLQLEPGQEGTVLLSARTIAESADYFVEDGVTDPEKNLGRILRSMSPTKVKEGKKTQILVHDILLSEGSALYLTNDKKDVKRYIIKK